MNLGSNAFSRIPLLPKISNAPQVCCLSASLRGSLSLVEMNYLCFALQNYKLFLNLANKNQVFFQTFHIFSSFQSFGNPMEDNETTSLYSSSNAIKRFLNGDVGFTV